MYTLQINPSATIATIKTILRTPTIMVNGCVDGILFAFARGAVFPLEILKQFSKVHNHPQNILYKITHCKEMIMTGAILRSNSRR